MKLEGSEQSQRFDLILALLQKKGELSYHDKVALEENIKKLESFLFTHELKIKELNEEIRKQKSIIDAYLGKGRKVEVKG